MIAWSRRDVGDTLLNDPTDAAILAAATGVAWAFAIELNITIFLTFKRKRGLYFWSLLACSWGLSIHAFAFILKFLAGSSWLIYIPFIEVGWVLMVTGQAFVLYSRLHLVVRTQKTLRLVLWLIIFDAIFLHIPTIVLTIGSNDPYANHNIWQINYNIMERIQLAGFCIQEFIISGIYLWSVVRVFKSIQHESTRRVMTQLIIINALCIGMDTVVIGLEYSNRYVGEVSVKAMIYAIKLKLEFVVLNQLVNLTLAGRGHVSRRAVEGYELHGQDATGPGGSKPKDSGKQGGIRNSVHHLKPSSPRPGWLASPTLSPIRPTYKSSSDGAVLEAQQRVNPGSIVSISANEPPRNGSMWARTMKRSYPSHWHDDDAEIIGNRAVRAQTTTIVTSEAIDPAEENGSTSSSQDKILSLPHRPSNV